MKTQRAGSKVLKNLLLILSVAMIAVSCGQDNTSGQSSTNDNINGFGSYSNYGTVNGVDINQVLAQVSIENNCIGSGQFGNQNVNGTQRIQTSVQANVNANGNNIYMGVSTYGDIAVVAGGRVDLYLCPRQAMNQTVQQLSQIILNYDQLCPVSKIDSATFEIQSQTGYPYRFGIAPIHIPGTDRISSLCSR